MTQAGNFITLDTETRALEDLTAVGPARYFEDPFAALLCACWSFGSDEEVHLWHCATEGIEESPFPTELFRRIEQGWLVEAHNVMFERRAFEMMTRRYGWPAIPVAQLRCSAAKAAYHALPRSLKSLGKALGAQERKSARGKEIIRLLSHPTVIAVPPERTRKGKETMKEKAWRSAHEEILFAESLGERPKHFRLSDGRLAVWDEDQGLIRENWEYCKQDVRTESECSAEMPDLPEKELEVWRMDQEMNYRGIRVDRELCTAAIETAAAEGELLRGEMEWLAGVRCTRPAVQEFLQPRCGIPNLQKEVVDDYLAKLKAKKINSTDNKDEWLNREVLDIYRKVSRSSIAKYGAMLARVCADGRVKDTLMYSGAHTTRWTGRGVQPHNFPRGAIKHMDAATEIIKERDRGWMSFLYGDAMLLLSHALRGAIVAGEGKTFYVADYAAVEARVLFWLADAAEALEIFERSDTDIYCDLAGKIYRRGITKADATERQFGKQGILGLGFGMGFCKFLMTCRKYGINFTRQQVIDIVGEDDYRRIGTWIKTTRFMEGNSLGHTPGTQGGAGQVVRAGLASRGLPFERNLLFKQNMPELVLAKYVVNLYRKGYPQVPNFWDRQEEAAINAVDIGKRNATRYAVDSGKISWEYMPGKKPETNRLLARLPSGREQTYWQPNVPTERETRINLERIKARRKELRNQGLDPDLCPEEMQAGLPRLRYMEVDERTLEFREVSTYGGKITENLVQHVARDLMADAMVRIERHPDYDNVLTVHDEVVSESPLGRGSREEYQRLIAEGDPWTRGCPIAAEEWIGPRYKKA